MFPSVKGITQSIRSWLRRHVFFIPMYGSDYGLVLYLPFEEGTGTTVYDQSPCGHDGVFGAGAAAPSWTDGKFGKALSFDGGDYVDSGFTVPAGSCTYLAWIKPTVTPSALMYIHAVQNYGAAGGRILRTSSTGKINFEAMSDTPTTFTIVGEQPIINEWIHVAGVLDVENSELRLYVNGRSVATPVAISGAWTTQLTNHKVGKRPETNLHYWTGDIDEVRLYDRALSVEEIRAHYLRGRGMYSRSVTVSDKFRILGTDLAEDFKIVDGEVTVHGLSGNAGWYVKVDADGKLYIEAA